MQIRNSTARWGALAQLLHWTIVALIIVQYVIAEIADGLPLGPDKLGTLARHKSVGITIFALALLRLLWRAVNTTPPLPESLRPWERTAARLTHGALYALLFAMPLTGWMMSSARNFPVSWFGLVQLPDLVRPSKPAYDFLHETHETLFVLLVAVAALHALAALRHHFVLRDDVLRRMLPAVAGMAAAAGLHGAVQPADAIAPDSGTAYASDPANSSLGFEFVQAGARSTGSFHRFTVRLELPRTAADPDAGAGAAGGTGGSLDVTIDVGSLDTQDGERDELLRGADLFDVAKYPTARFVARRITRRSATDYSAAGELTIRDVTRPLTIPFRLSTAGGKGGERTRMQGAVMLRRLDFGVGRGEWQSTEWVGDEVRVSFAIALRPAAETARSPRAPTRSRGA